MRVVPLLLLLGASTVSAADWPGVKYTEVRAYFYNADSEHSRHFILPDGKLDPSASPSGGVGLNPAQVARLLAAINGPAPTHPVTSCYVPHHAFAFYNSWGRRVAVFEFCLECLKASADPNTAGPYHNYPALAELIAELKLSLGPKFRTPRDYRRKYNQMSRSTS